MKKKSQWGKICLSKMENLFIKIMRIKVWLRSGFSKQEIEVYQNGKKVLVRFRDKKEKLFVKNGTSLTKKS